jgi:hypothetical protein
LFETQAPVITLTVIENALTVLTPAHLSFLDLRHPGLIIYTWCDFDMLTNFYYVDHWQRITIEELTILWHGSYHGSCPSINGAGDMPVVDWSVSPTLFLYKLFISLQQHPGETSGAADTQEYSPFSSPTPLTLPPTTPPIPSAPLRRSERLLAKNGINI